MGCQDPDGYFRVVPHIGFFAFFWLTEGSRNKKLDICIKQIHPAHIFIKVFGYSDRHGDRKGVKT